MIYQIKNIFTFLLILVPFFLITGPAIPDIIITLSGLFFLFWFFLNKNKTELLNNNLIVFSLMFWLSLILISFFAYNKEKSLQEAIIFLRYLIIPICCYFLFFKDQKYLNYLLLLVLILVFL